MVRNFQGLARLTMSYEESSTRIANRTELIALTRPPVVRSLLGERSFVLFCFVFCSSYPPLPTFMSVYAGHLELILFAIA